MLPSEHLNGKQQLTFVDFAGKTEWTLGGDVVQHVSSSPGHIVVTNTSGQQIIVDAATGKPAVLSPDVTAAILGVSISVHSGVLGNRPPTVLVADPASDVVAYDRDDVVHHVNYHAVCG